MKYLTYPLESQGFINRCLTTKTYTKSQQFDKVTLKGKVNEWLKYGFSIHENPCRKEFINHRIGNLPEFVSIEKCKLHNELQVFDEKRTFEMYFPFGNVGVDFSEFYNIPTYLRCYSYVELYSNEEREEMFHVETCGGITVWMNEEFITDFIPFTRNMVKSNTFKMKLKKGYNQLLLCLDDLAERDTDFYYRLQYLGDSTLEMCLPVEDQVDLNAMKEAEKILEEISFDKELYISEVVELAINNTSGQELPIHVSYKPVADKLTNAHTIGTEKDYVIKPDQKTLPLFEADDVIPGFYYFGVEIQIGTISIGRKIATQIFHKKLLKHKESTIAQRKLEALKYLEEVEVDNVYKAASILMMNGDTKKAERIIEEELQGIALRKDCSDFHLVIVMQIYKKFHSKLSSECLRKIELTILEFRYWIDEPGDDVMWFFSENHALLFHICQYFAGQFFKDSLFESSSLTGRELSLKAEGLLDEWFSYFLSDYITEWNSNAYIPVDVLGLCSLYNLAEDGCKYKAFAKEGLNRLFYDMAVNSHDGAIMTTFGRSYEKELKGNYTAGTTSLLYIAYNHGCLNRAALAYIAFILGDYEPPIDYNRYLSLGDKEELIWEKTQGFEKHVDLYMYKNNRVQLSTAVNFRPFTEGYQEHIMQATIDKTAQVFINHPGEIQPYGNGRPNFWAGNGSLPRGVQYKNIGILEYHIPETHRIDFTHAYIPLQECDNYIGDVSCVVIEKNDSYIGVLAQQGLMMQSVGPCKFREFISFGRDNIWVIKVGRKEEYQSLQNFYAHMKKTLIQATETGYEIIDSEYGSFKLEKDDVLYQEKSMLRKEHLSSQGILNISTIQTHTTE
ncbi:MAG TPA: hypothetical protein DHW61_13180 [Lachnoclostridium phytofermentans]|uniref:Uncharacterized protein n=1 Tax=Lachnoclostridium phytofermentans TaxID=66219 RepID=A0A3D2X8M2_9FIRM|nr:hypothetical protein [Lachnoclostridium sp.]HCL03336.1 hypothetical protein [Lachnoclostridium phytofermentans]